MYDLVIIGSGPGGYVCAIRAAQKNLRVALVEKYTKLGGTCLNVGCIPSKNLLHSSNLFYQANNKFQKYGIEIEGLQVNWKKMQTAKKQIVDKTNKGIQFLMRKNNIDCYTGSACFVDTHKICIKKDNGVEKKFIKAKNFVIATGSKPATLPNILIDKKRIISSTQALSLSKLPKSLVIVGGGVIGCELGSIYAKLGVKITVIESFEEIISTMDKELSTSLRKILRQIGINFLLGYNVSEVIKNEDKILVKAKNQQGELKELIADYLLLAVGRKPFTQGLALEKIGVSTNEKGNILVDKNLQTSIKNIYAIGDVIGGMMLAHKAEEEGIFIADKLAGEIAHLNYTTIASVVYTIPEVAGVGYNEQDLQKKSISYNTGQFSFQSLGRARASGETEGFVKVLANRVNDEILGVHIIGARATDLIAEAVIAMEYKATSEDLAMTTHAHPTFSEALKEACMDAFNQKPIHQ